MEKQSQQNRLCIRICACLAAVGQERPVDNAHAKRPYSYSALENPSLAALNSGEDVRHVRIVMFAIVVVSSACSTAPQKTVQFEVALPLAKKNNCLACHGIDQKIVGPSFKDVAARYQGQDVQQQLFRKVRNGGSGVWGVIPEPPNMQISEENLKLLIRWITEMESSADKKVTAKLATAGVSASAKESTPVRQSSQLSDVERKKRHLVSRFYEITEWGATRCPIEKYPGYHSALSGFQAAFPELSPLINASPHRAYAEQMKRQAESSDFAKSEAMKWRDNACEFYEEAMNSNAHDERGKKTIREVIELLKQ